ncbi:MAG TPA: tetratricopeptide repeat protein [Gemmataceae bacterium]|nr:tetratricopeptide repeat protein [Gemmataceae bacterium]
MSTLPDSTRPPDATSDGRGESLGPPIPGPVLDSLPSGLTARYRVEGELGRGGMGAVLRGHDPVMHRDLALKVLLAEHCAYPELVYRFFREAQLSGQLQHPGVAPVHDMGRLPDQRPYFAMKLVEGRTLAALLAERDAPARDLPRFLKIFEQICQTLAYAHARRIIHRDLKPANVMVGAFGEVLVMDWGLAKPLDGGEPATLPPLAIPHSGDRGSQTTIDAPAPAPEAGQSQPGAVLGTPAYMPPEQARGQIDRLDERSDVFGLGAVLCEILTGKPPYHGGSGMDILLKAAGVDLADAFARLDRCGADAELVQLARACLAPEQDDRPRDGRAVADAVTAYLAGVQERLRAAELERAAAQARADGERKRRRLWTALGAAVLLLIVLGAGGGLWFVQDRAARQVEETKRRAEETKRQAEELRLAQEKARDAKQALDESDDFRRRAKWPEAAAALERAAGRLGNDGPADLASRLQQGRRELKTVVDLDEVRMRSLAIQTSKTGKADDSSTTAEAYADKFRADYDFVLESDRLSAEAERIAASPIKQQLTTALDAWAGADTDPTRHKRLLDLLHRVDPNPWRDRLWRLLDQGDGPGLERLAREMNLDEAPAALPSLLSIALMAREDKSETALNLLRAAQRRRPGDFWANALLGMWLSISRPKEKAKAAGYLRAALAIRPDNALAMFELGGALIELGERDEGLALVRQANALAPGFPGIQTILANDLVSQNKPREAEDALRAILAKHPDDAAAQLGLGGALVAQSRWKEALPILKRAVELDPNSVEAQSVLGVALFQLDRPAEAADVLRKALQLKPDDADTESKAELFLGLSLLKLEKCEEAADAFRAALKAEPDNSNSYVGLGRALTGLDKPEDALAAFRKALALAPDDEQANYYLGLALVQDHAAEALEYLTKAAAKSPDDPDVQFFLGSAYYKRERYEEAIDAFRKTLALQPDRALGHVFLGMALMNDGRFKDGLAELQRGDELGSKQPDWKMPSGVLIRMCRGLMALDAKLPAILQGKAKPANAEEEADYAELCLKYNKKLYAASVRFYTDAFAKDPTLADDAKAGRRLDAARAAARAGAGEGDAASASAGQRAEWRRQALDWLRDDLAAQRKRLTAGTATAEEVRQALGEWKDAADLASIRDEAALAKLPADERRDFGQLWSDVDDLLKQAGGPEKP